MAPINLFSCATTLLLTTAAFASPTTFPLTKRGSTIPSNLRAQWVQHQAAQVQNKIQSSLANYEKNKNNNGKLSAFGAQLQTSRSFDGQPAKRAGTTASANLTECNFSFS